MEKNEMIRNEVLQAVEGISVDKLNEKLEEGKWTIMQVLEHLYLMERAITHAISDQLANGESKTVKEKPIELTVNRSTTVKAPSFVHPSEEFITLAEMHNKLSLSREAFSKIVDAADDSLLEQRGFPHPVFGELSLKQWIPFVGLHEKRHLAQIEELKRKI
ncbi:DinB family protein [Peribacillus glennii]|uniref:DinB family protein n=1 Tax=Peribacillus glennii TaxID=2303991 RepID=A0A372L7N0_9BACI|nr:DinB family protein [Peribacillus glennii]RFU61250.1 DinB family protein [Peribacillus glennii]